MALIVEDGTGMPDADSYISLTDAREYAAKYGYTLPTDDTEAEVALRKGAVNVDVNSIKGSKLSSEQALEFPRVNLYCNDVLAPIETQLLKAGQAQVIYADRINAGTDIRGDNDGKRVIEETVVGAVSVKYDRIGADSSTVQITEALDKLRCYLDNGNGLTFRTRRS